MSFKCLVCLMSMTFQRSASSSTSSSSEPPKPIDPSKAKRCTNPSQRFTGRDDALKKIEACFFADDGQQHIFVLHGLGGAGKTQIAYKFISEFCYKLTTDENSEWCVSCL